jgi:ATP-dependent helicase/nuclease subunit B
VNLRDKPNIFTIAPGAPFLPTLAKSLVNGKLVSDFMAGSDPLALATATIYVPTRRAARALRSEFAQLSGVNAAILPSIRPLGEFDDDFDLSRGSLTHAPTIGREERLIQLARMVRQWAQALPETTRNLFGSDPVVLPSTSADAVWLARNLADLMDEAERDGGDWTKLKDLVPEDHANWWQLTLGFMKIVTEHWPRHLAENDFSDTVAHRNVMIRAEAERLANLGSHGPVIAAGSTGSMPATAELLKVISRLPNGALVLPGLDISLDEAAWDAIGNAENNASVFGHPQFGLRKLLTFCGATRDDVSERGAISENASSRNAAISLALLPADETGAWSNVAGHIGGFDTVCEMVAASESAEALAIAAALRGAVELGHTPAALVTADRMLARRVSAELERFGGAVFTHA